MKKPPFRLYPEEKHWWSFADYGAVLAVMERLQPKRVLEFGPGNSTLALIEGGAEHIDACEDDSIWFNVYKERIADAYPDVVTFVPYVWADPVTIPAIEAQRYDLALIDGPHGTLNRPAVIAYCLARCAAVLVPTEEIAYGKGALRPHIERLAAEFGRDIEWMETGPLSGGFALLTERPIETDIPGVVGERPDDADPGDLAAGFLPEAEAVSPPVTSKRARRRRGKGGGA